MTQEEAKTIHMRIDWGNDESSSVSLTKTERDALLEAIKTNINAVIVHQFDDYHHEAFNLAHARSVSFLDNEAIRAKMEKDSTDKLKNP